MPQRVIFSRASPYIPPAPIRLQTKTLVRLWPEWPERFPRPCVYSYDDNRPARSEPLWSAFVSFSSVPLASEIGNIARQQRQSSKAATSQNLSLFFCSLYGWFVQVSRPSSPRRRYYILQWCTKNTKWIVHKLINRRVCLWAPGLEKWPDACIICWE